MKILYISSNILRKANSASIRNVGLINGLNKNGAKVDILTIKYPEEMEDFYFKKFLKQNKIYTSRVSLVYNYFKLQLKNSKSIERKIIKNKIFYYFKSLIKELILFPAIDKDWLKEFRKQKINYKKYDLVISSSDSKTSHFIAEKIKNKNKNIKWIQIWGDPWSIDITLNKLRKRRSVYFEKRLLKNCDLALYVSPITIQVLKEKYLKLREKIKYIPRGYLEEVVSEKNKTDFINIVYTGGITKFRNIFPLLDKIKNYNLNNIKKIKLNIYGSTSEENVKHFKEYKFLTFNGSVSFEKIKLIYEKADILLFLDNGRSSTQIPGKIYDYLGTNKKILCCFQEKNDVYNYFKTIEGLLVYQEKDLNLKEIINFNDRNVNKNFSNLEIAKRLLEMIKKDEKI